MNKKIKIIISIALLITIVILFNYYNVIPSKVYTNEDFKIEKYLSNNDQDQDGIDDQSDILRNAQNYIKERPKYKSKYYDSGYSNDKYGVCTDVIAVALLNSGYDLKKLVNQDIINNPSHYNLKTIDENIDFRRVVNLKAYFKNNALALTTNLNEIDQWQGGDIVIFENHIGIISDKRNEDGIPLLIHHKNPFQLFYEEDVLENYQKIEGHYRIS